MKKHFILLVLLSFFKQTILKAQVNCAFTASVISGCAPLVVSFQDQSTGAITFYWDFDYGGNSSSLKNASANYPTPGIYNVMHVAFNGTVSDTVYKQIRVFQPPTANFMAPDKEGCNNPCHLVHLTNQTILGESAVADSNYVWNFGDGSLPESGHNITHCYNQVGSYDVTLIALDNNGCQVSKTLPNYVVIGQSPTAAATANPTQSCLSTQLINFSGLGTSPNGAVNFSWNFGNGYSSQQNPVQAFSCGIYNPVLTVTDPLGCIGTDTVRVEIPCLSAGFKTASTNGCVGIALQFTDTSNYASSWSWDFGDGSTSTLQNPTHAYNTNGTYSVSLTVTYAGCTDTKTKFSYINITDPVSFTFSADDYSNCSAPFTINFSSNVTGGTPTAYNWNFGDGNSSSLANPSYTYTTTGTFTVMLGISNSNGCVNTQTLSNKVSVGALHANFSFDSINGCTPMLVQFTNSSTSDVGITNYDWQFGDSSANSSVQNPLHDYTVAGIYVPQLTVQDSNGCRNTFVSPDTIKVAASLSSDFSATPLMQCVNEAITFTNLTLGGTAETSYLWDFGDHETDTLTNPIHHYSDTGYYHVSLTVINQGCSTTVKKMYYIHIVVPKADYAYSNNCVNPTTVIFSDSSQGADTWLWDFGDGTPTDTQQNPVHIFPAEGTYNVKLTVTNATTGCTDFKSLSISVGTPNAGFTADIFAGCYPVAIQFTDTSLFAQSWLWDFGDGNTSVLKNPVHTFRDTGQFSVRLIINPNAACSDTTVKPNYITAYGVKLGYDILPTSGCAPLTVNFANQCTSYMGTITSTYWKSGDGRTDSGQTTSFTYDTVGGYVSYMHVTDSHGCTAEVYKNILPRIIVAGFISDSVVCPGEPIIFTNNPSYTLAQTNLWSFGDGTTSTALNPTHTYTSSGTYTVSLISGNYLGCKDTVTRNNFIDVSTPKADFYVASTFSPCPPFPVKFHNSTNRTNLNWLWYFGDGDTSTAQDPLHVYFLPGDYSVTLIAWSQSGCRDTMTYTDLIRIRGPVGNFVVTPDSGCVPLTVNISGTTQSTVSVIGDLGDGAAYNNTLNLNHTYQTVGTYYPVFTLTDSVGCKVSYSIDTIVVGLIPYPNLPPDTSICKGNNVLFNLPYGDHFLWTSDAPDTYLTCDTCKQTISSSRDTITYFVTAMTNIGCVAKDTITVNVDALPQIYPGLHYRICPNDTLQLSAGNNVAAAVWEPSLFMNDSTKVNPLVWPPDSITYRVTGSNSTGCSISRIVKVWTINKVEADLISVGDTVKCEGGTVALNVNVLQSSFNDTTFQWIPSTYLNSSTIQNPILNAPVGNYTYKVIVGSSNCVADTETIHITFYPNPKIEAGDDQTVAVGTTVRLWASSPDDVSYTWLPMIDSMTCTNCRRPYVTATKDQTIPVVVTSQLGCTDTAFVHLRVVGCDDKMVFVPNVFTPNNDGLNDRLYVRGGGLRSLEYFRVFDRWGKMIFETHDINEGWDGTVNGKNADLATYVYLLKGTCSSGADVQKSGNVTIIR